MKLFFFRMAIVLLLVFLQLSFFDILFPWFHVPILILVAVVAWTLVSGFPHALFMTVPLTILFDAVLQGAVGAFSLYAILLAYGTSFLSRRLLIEHRGLSLGLYGLFAAFSAVAYQLPFLLFSGVPTGLAALTTTHSLSWFSFDMLVFSFLCTLSLFIVTYWALRRFESYADVTAQRQFSNIR